MQTTTTTDGNNGTRDSRDLMQEEWEIGKTMNESERAEKGGQVLSIKGYKVRDRA